MKPPAPCLEHGAVEQRPFGSLPREVAVIGQGTRYIDDAHQHTAVAALRRGIDLGIDSERLWTFASLQKE